MRRLQKAEGTIYHALINHGASWDVSLRLSNKFWWFQLSRSANRHEVHPIKSLPSGKHTKSYWKWPFSAWIYPLKMVISHSYVSLPEGKGHRSWHVSGAPSIDHGATSGCFLSAQWPWPAGQPDWSLKKVRSFLIFSHLVYPLVI